MANTDSTSKIGHNQSKDELSVEVHDAIKLMAGYGPLSSSEGGVSKGTPVEILQIAALTCLGSSGAAGMKDEAEKKAAGLLKPGKLISLLKEGGKKSEEAMELMQTASVRFRDLSSPDTVFLAKSCSLPCSSV